MWMSKSRLSPRYRDQFGRCAIPHDVFDVHAYLEAKVRDYVPTNDHARTEDFDGYLQRCRVTAMPDTKRCSNWRLAAASVAPATARWMTEPPSAVPTIARGSYGVRNCPLTVISVMPS